MTKKNRNQILIIIIILLLLWYIKKKKNRVIDPKTTEWDGKFWTCNSNQNMAGVPYNVLDDNSCRQCTDQEVLIWNTYVENYTVINDPQMYPQPTNCYWKTKKRCREASSNGMPDANNNGMDYMNMCQCNAGKPENCDL